LGGFHVNQIRQLSVSHIRELPPLSSNPNGPADINDGGNGSIKITDSRGERNTHIPGTQVFIAHGSGETASQFFRVPSTLQLPRNRDQ
jgi:hypothetical protein